MLKPIFGLIALFIVVLFVIHILLLNAEIKPMYLLRADGKEELTSLRWGNAYLILSASAKKTMYGIRLKKEILLFELRTLKMSKMPLD